jgi:flagellar basal-body rod protein FlgB
MLSSLSSHLERYMDLLSTRQKIVASNIANSATPGYKTKDIDFQFEFQAALADPTLKPDVIEPSGLKSANDGNNVSLDRESRLLAENALRFNVASNLWKSQFRQIKSAIQEGRNG